MEAFLTPAAAIPVSEIGDKTQLASLAPAAKYPDLASVVASATLGMLSADMPAIFLGKIAAANFLFKYVRRCAATIFAILGLTVLSGSNLNSV